MFRSLKENMHAVVDLSVILMIGIAFAGMMVLGYVLWVVVSELNDNISGSSLGSWVQRDANNTLVNVTTGFDSAVNLILVAVTIFILALAISALLLLRQR